MRLLASVLLVALMALGCAPETPEVQILEVTRGPVPLPQHESTVRAAGESRVEEPSLGEPTRTALGASDAERPSMTQVLRERGVPDQVGNEGGRTLWTYHTAEKGVETFTFEKGKFVSHQALPAERAPGPGSQGGTP